MHEIRPCGTAAFLVTPSAPVSVLGLVDALRRADRRDVVEIVPGAATVLVVARRGTDGVALRRWVSTLDVRGASDRAARVEDPLDARPVELDVVYDGVDLADVAGACGLSVADVVERHARPLYRCTFCGFAPGFAYLEGLDATLVLPRRPTPRTRVPAGSVAIAGAQSAVYPSPSPGGWHLLGRTDATLWDPSRVPPALIEPGALVRFRPVGRLAAPTPTAAQAPPPGASARRITVVEAGWSTTVQDGGRAGLAHLGVPAAGALDPSARSLVNRLVGNDEDAAVLETAGGLVVAADTPAVVAESTTRAVRTLRSGEQVRVDPRPGDSWAYLAVRGGIDVPPVLGSRSYDTLGAIGPAPPRAGTVYALGPDPGTALLVDQAPGPPPPSAPVVVRARLGPRHDWFPDDMIERLAAERWRVGADRSRAGVRLLGTPVDRRPHRVGRELPSEGLVVGAIQVPPDGGPVVMLNDHPTTGGYPVVAVVDAEDIARLAQLPAGSQVHLRVSRAEIA